MAQLQFILNSIALGRPPFVLEEKRVSKNYVNIGMLRSSYSTVFAVANYSIGIGVIGVQTRPNT